VARVDAPVTCVLQTPLRQVKPELQACPPLQSLPLEPHVPHVMTLLTVLQQLPEGQTALPQVIVPPAVPVVPLLEAVPLQRPVAPQD